MYNEPRPVCFFFQKPKTNYNSIIAVTCTHPLETEKHSRDWTMYKSKCLPNANYTFALHS